MFDSYVTVLGTVLNTPERRMTKNNAAVANFRIASHPRRYDRETQGWVDAPSLRIRVNCWRRLAEHVCSSVFSGDPVVVYGRIVTREWVTDQGEQRMAYELEAVTVGHDLGRGTAAFTRSRPEPSVTVVEDAEDGGPAPLAGPSGVDGDARFDDFAFADGPSTVDALAILSAAGIETRSGIENRSGVETTSGDDEDEEGDDEESVGVTGRARKRGRQPVGV